MNKKEKAEKILEKHLNENDLNFIFYEKKKVYNEIVNAIIETLSMQASNQKTNK